jgi:hypothetical protein
MDLHRIVPALLVLCLLCLNGCKRGQQETHHVGAKVSIADFSTNTAAYRGKAVMLPLRIDEPIVRASGQSLRNYLGRDVKFTTRGPEGQRLPLVIKIPEGLTVPEVGNSDEVFVTFLCTLGSQQQGNEARVIQTP